MADDSAKTADNQVSSCLLFTIRENEILFGFHQICSKSAGSAMTKIFRPADFFQPGQET
jgi:hypothetical protein